jgi:hypothetical protein
MATAARSRYEILVRTRVSPAALARLRIALTPTAVPRQTVYRLRVPADRDITEVVKRLTERGIQLLEIHKSPGRPGARRRSPDDTAADEPRADVIVPFRTAVTPPVPIQTTVQRRGGRIPAPATLPTSRPAG